MSSESSERNLFKPGTETGIVVINLANPNLHPRYPLHFTTSRIAGGGFYGQVIIPLKKDYVVKTTRPDTTRELMRLLNWGLYPFPSQVDKNAAELDHLSTSIIHTVVSRTTEHYAPFSLGYTHIKGLGFAQVIERINGRPLRYDLGEYEPFKRAQESLKGTGFKYGFEQSGQPHQDNPFALANLWWDLDRKSIIWLDTLPAMPHKPVFGVVPYGFQTDVRKQFYGDDYLRYPPTFNTIHTDLTRQAVEHDRSAYDKTTYTELMRELELYDQIQVDFKSSYHPKKQVKQALELAFALSGELGIDILKKPIPKILSGIIDSLKIAFTSQGQRDAALSGIRKAYAGNLVTQDELRAAEKTLAEHGIWKRENLIAAAPPALYLSIGSASWLVAGAAGFDMYQGGKIFEQGFSFDSAGDALKIYAARWLMSNIPKGAISEAGTRLTNSNFRTAFLTSLIPGIGDLIASSGHLAGKAAGQDPQILHFLIRQACANFSSLVPSGGTGSQLEADIYRKIGVRIEKALAHSNS